MYLANCTRLDIAFTLSLVARHSVNTTRMPWTCVKTILRYNKGTQDLGLFFSRQKDQKLMGYADVGYLLDPLMLELIIALCVLFGATVIS
jgi:hypothetical protein